MSTLHWGAYNRKSTESDERQVQSIEDQQKYTKNWEQQTGQSVLSWFSEAKSAKAPYQRDEFTRLMEAIQKGKINALVAWHPDRLARNSVDGGLIIWLLDTGQLQQLHFHSYSFVNTPEGKLMLGMIFAQSKYQVDKLSTDVRRGLKTKIEQGVPPFRALPGYLNNLEEHTLIRDPERFEVVRQAMLLVASGSHTPDQALYILNDEWGFTTKKTKKTGGGPLSRTTWYNMLNDPYYTGFFLYNNVLIQGSYDPMLTETEFQALQAAVHRTRKARNRKWNHPYTGLLFCGRCGCMVTASRSKGRIYYHCTNAKGICDKHGLPETELERQIHQTLWKTTLPPTLEKLLLNAIQRFEGEEMGKEMAIYTQLHRSVEAAESERRELVRLRSRQQIEEEEFLPEKQRLDTLIKDLREKVSGTEFNLDRNKAIADGVIDFAAHAREDFLFGDIERKRFIAGQLGARYLLKGRTIEVEYHPLLVPLVEGLQEIETIKPMKTGSESKKDGSFEPSVPLGWAEGIVIKLMQAISQPGIVCLRRSPQLSL